MRCGCGTSARRGGRGGRLGEGPRNSGTPRLGRAGGRPWDPGPLPSFSFKCIFKLKEGIQGHNFWFKKHRDLGVCFSCLFSAFPRDVLKSLSSQNPIGPTHLESKLLLPLRAECPLVTWSLRGPVSLSAQRGGRWASFPAFSGRLFAKACLVLL